MKSYNSQKGQISEETSNLRVGLCKKSFSCVKGKKWKKRFSYRFNLCNERKKSQR